MSENEPQYWRMQLHPNDPDNSMLYTVQCLAHGFIGLDFGKETKNLEIADISLLPPSEKRFVPFAKEMKSGDIVLIMSHNKPLALVKVIGEYVYIAGYRQSSVWCHHYRPVKVLGYYADWGGGTEYLKSIGKSSTIQKIEKQTGPFYKFVDEWFHVYSQ